ncbi:MAG: DASS family sodium-coupled anion symporter [Candidatus Korobacteraceae bacterium]|jgi:DASS family divalent anion:Na+ symporter
MVSATTHPAQPAETQDAKKNAIRGIICVLIAAVVWMCPVPQGLTPLTWHLLAIYLGAVFGVCLRPAPEPVVLLAALSVVAVCLKQLGIALSAFAESTPWLMWTAFLIGYFFNETGLGSRISYALIGKLGRSSLRLGYVAAIADVIIAPATPSNTARTGGLLFPIFQSVAFTLDSRPGSGARRIGSYLMVLMYQISLCTAAMFITAGAINALNLSFAKNILHTEVSWPLWALAMSVPGVICLALLPYLVYKLYPPEIKEVDNKKIAAEGYKRLGPMSGNEKKLVVLFVLALIGWSTSTITKLDPSAVAIAFVALAILTGIVTWDKVLACKNAWSILIWYAGIVSLANGLSKLGFFAWLGKLLGQHMQFAMGNKMIFLVAVILLGIVVRYLFASTIAFIATMVPLLYTLGAAAQLPPIPLILLVAASSQLASAQTHYSNACGPILFGAGYVPQSTWWKIGHITTYLGMTIYFIVGLAWWRLLGLW